MLPSADMKVVSMARGQLWFGMLLVLVLGFTVLTPSREIVGPPQEPKPLTFSHDLHVNGNGMNCMDCHDSAFKSKTSSDNLLAKKRTCQMCHEDQIEQNCTFCHTSDDPATYLPAVPPERELQFSHEQHVDKRHIDCQTCHQDLDKKGPSFGEHVPAMSTCTTCHNATVASSACETCHTDFAALRPRDHKRTDFTREHKRLARAGDASCASCHAEESCIDCHNSAGVSKVDLPGRDLVSPRSPQLTTIDRGQPLTLSKVHDLNFKYTHGITASGRIADCQTCHRQESFCGTCHQAGGNINQLKFKPKSHEGPGFVTIGVGSGGGKHALIAKRDLESCASCHDAQGADPVCMTCHVDADGIRGTDPKTHPVGFMRGTNGEWHTNPGATCYTCHNDPNAHLNGYRGSGFCSYCHK